MIRLFSGTSRNTRRRSKSDDRLDPKLGSRRKTIDGCNIDPLEKLRNVKEEATRKWEEEKEDFNRRKMKHNTQLAEIERQEILKREDALSRIENKLEEMRKTHKAVENVFENQIMNIEEKLRKQKCIHQEEESALLQKATSMKSQISEVQSIYEKRMFEIEAPFASTKPISVYHEALDDMSIISSTIKLQKSEKSYESSIYPTVPAYASTPTLEQTLPCTRMNDFNPQFMSNRPRYTDAWLTAGYLGTMSSDCSKVSKNISKS